MRRISVGPRRLQLPRGMLMGIVVIVCAACAAVNAPSSSSPATGASPSTVAAPSTALASAGAATLAPAPSESAVVPTPSSPPPTTKPRKSHTPKPSSSPTATPTATATPTPTPTPTPTEAPKPDLIIKSFGVPATVTHDVDASGAMYVQNLGPGDVGAFAVDIYGSCAQEALSLAPVNVTGLAAGAEKFIHITFSFSSIGACKVGATIDSDNQVAESNESNNEVSVDVTSQ